MFKMRDLGGQWAMFEPPFFGEPYESLEEETDLTEPQAKRRRHFPNVENTAGKRGLAALAGLEGYTLVQDQNRPFRGQHDNPVTPEAEKTWEDYYWRQLANSMPMAEPQFRPEVIVEFERIEDERVVNLHLFDETEVKIASFRVSGEDESRRYFFVKRTISKYGNFRAIREHFERIFGNEPSAAYSAMSNELAWDGKGKKIFNYKNGEEISRVQVDELRLLGLHLHFQTLTRALVEHLGGKMPEDQFGKFYNDLMAEFDHVFQMGRLAREAELRVSGVEINFQERIQGKNNRKENRKRQNAEKADRIIQWKAAAKPLITDFLEKKPNASARQIADFVLKHPSFKPFIDLMNLKSPSNKGFAESSPPDERRKRAMSAYINDLKKIPEAAAD